MTNFHGSGKKINAADIERAAKFLNVRQAGVRAVIEVEANGSGFDSMGNVKFLFEPHRFYAEIGDDTVMLKEAIRQGLAYKSWKGPGSYPKSVQARWEQFQKACALDVDKAIRAASWGLGQIMGSEHREAGYNDPEDMVEDFAKSEGNQLMGMAKLIKARRLDVALRKFPDISACRAFALRYNGKAYEKNQYHTKLQSSFNRWILREQSTAPIVADDGVLRVGSYNTRVGALQVELSAKGYKIVGKPDNKYGNLTRDAVNSWKADNGKEQNGEMNAQDLLDLENGPSRPISAERSEVTAAELAPDSSIVRDTQTAKKGGITLGGVIGGATLANESGLLDNVSEYADQAQRASGVWNTIKYTLQDWGITDLLGFIVEYRFPILCVAFGAALILFWRIQKARVKMHQEAEVA